MEEVDAFLTEPKKPVPMFRPDLDTMRRYVQVVREQEGRRGGSVSAHTLALEAATLIAWAEHLERHLAEATATIILAQDELPPCSGTWQTLDGYDGSGDATEQLKDQGYEWRGDGWVSPRTGGGQS